MTLIINKIKKIKFELLVVLFAFFLSVLLALHNLKTFDNNKLNYKGNWYNQFIYVDTGHNWSDADDFRERLKNGKSFFNALPAYEKYFLPTITVGLYYYFIDKEIFVIKSNGQKVIKTGNYKFGYLFIQIIFFYLSILYFSKQLKKKVNRLLFKLIILFLCLDPSIIQWHSSMWTESIFLSLLIFLFSFILKENSNYIYNFLIGLVVGLLFSQRIVSFLYVIPVLIYFFFLRVKFKNYLFFFFGYLIIFFFIGYNNYKKTEMFYLLPPIHQYYSYYHYFAHIIYADKYKISREEASLILQHKENNWIKENEIDLNNILDFKKNVNYRNKSFVKIIISNPIFTFRFFAKKVFTMFIIHPLWVNENFYFDKTDPEAKKNPKKYYHANLKINIFYSFIIYFFACIGLYSFFERIYKKKKIYQFDIFLIFNIMTVLYFVLISGLWGNPKYLAPCILSIVLFFSMGAERLINFLKKKY
jgi:hypothetical protein